MSEGLEVSVNPHITFIYAGTFRAEMYPLVLKLLQPLAVDKPQSRATTLKSSMIVLSSKMGYLIKLGLRTYAAE